LGEKQQTSTAKGAKKGCNVREEIQTEASSPRASDYIPEPRYGSI